MSTTAQQDTISTAQNIVSRSTRNSPTRIRAKIMELRLEKSKTSTSGLENEESIQLLQILEARRFTLSCIMGKELTWRELLLNHIREQDPEFIFSDNEWLDLYQIYNETIAFKRLLQLTKS